MAYCLRLAQEAARRDEVPVGAVVVGPEGQLLAQAWNQREGLRSPLGHAEMLAIQRASLKLGAWRLSGCTLYVTLEPCVMCAGAIVQARLDRVVYGTPDPKGGAVESLYQVLQDRRLNHRCEVQCLGDQPSREILREFFAHKRRVKKNRG
jgi:tRNA(adenine34) deaminase